MPRYSPSSEGLTPHGRVGASSTSKVLLEGNDARSEVLISVRDAEALVSLALGSEAMLGEGPELSKADGLLRLETKSAISVITEAEGPNEEQKVTVAGAGGGTFTLTFNGKATTAIAFNATKEVVEEKLEALTTIGEGNVTVTGEAGGPFTVEFKGDLATQDVPELVADASELEAEGEAEPTVTVETTVPGGIDIVYAEA
jgi:hypothetical protein